MNYAVIRAIASGSLLVGLGMLTFGCAPDNPPQIDPNASTSMLGKSNIGKSSGTDGTNFEKNEDPPISADTRFAAGQLAETRGMPQEAIEQYQAALKLNPKHQATLYRLAVLQTQLHQFAPAIQTWKTYVLVTNESPEAWGNLGYCYQCASQPGEAEAAYQRGITRDPRNQTCRVNYGLMLASESRTVEAMVQFQAVLSEAESHYDVASVFEQMGRKEQAKVEYRKALALDPSLSDAQKRLDTMK